MPTEDIQPPSLDLPSCSFPWLPFVLQTSDPLFPTGSYAHSFGLEEFVRLSGAVNEGALHDFLTLQILPALTCLELPYFRFAHMCSGTNDLAGLVAIDREVNAWKIPSELRSASIRLGARRLDILLKITSTPLLVSLAGAIASGQTPGHNLTISAAQYATVPVEAALMTYLYQVLSSYCVAALKLLRIGQEACQRALSACLERASDILGDSLAIERSNAGCFNPLLEIASMRHETAFERLFIS